MTKEEMDRGFYVTPDHMIDRMLGKLDQERTSWKLKVLDPSAGTGAIAERMLKNYRREFRDISTIEIDETRQAVLLGKGFRLIDTDFLAYRGPDKFDVIIANPPFDHGDVHLLKAIDIMYCGEIVFLLNAETIRNPCTSIRKELVKRLGELNADIEYIQNAFVNAERQTGVEVALIYINIKRDIEEDLFAGAKDKADNPDPTIKTNHEVSTGKRIPGLVAEYDQVVNVGIETIVGYFRNYRKIGKYIGLDKAAKDESRSDETMTSQMKEKLNIFLKNVRTDFWRSTLDLPEVRNRMTKKRSDEFERQLGQRCEMDFTESNIRQFILNLIDGYEKMLTDAVLEIFNRFTIKHAWGENLETDNIHYFNGWKTNKAFAVNRKVIIPVYGGYGKGPFVDEYSGQWKLHWGVVRDTRDIDIVMGYFDGKIDTAYTIHEALEHALNRQESRNIESTYFTITVYKKGTMHLTFNDENILRRFNLAACRGKGWLPYDYSTKSYAECNPEEQAVIDSFEGRVSYDLNLGKPLYAPRKRLMIEGPATEAA